MKRAVVGLIVATVIAGCGESSTTARMQQPTFHLSYGAWVAPVKDSALADKL